MNKNLVLLGGINGLFLTPSGWEDDVPTRSKSILVSESGLLNQEHRDSGLTIIQGQFSIGSLENNNTC